MYPCIASHSARYTGNRPWLGELVLWIERFCRSLLAVAKSCSKPYVSLSNYLLHKSQFTQVQLCYGLPSTIDAINGSDLSSQEFIYAECKFLRIFSRDSLILIQILPLYSGFPRGHLFSQSSTFRKRLHVI